MLHEIFLRIEILYAASENNSNGTENNLISEAGSSSCPLLDIMTKIVMSSFNQF